jgi:non-ribosomal peptide synthetase component F
MQSAAAGPTECTLSSTTSIVSPGQQVTIGRPDPNVHCYVVDSQLRAVPVGVPGELLISGPRLGKGYIGRPDLTAAAYVPSPLYDDVKELVPSHMRQYYQTAYRTGEGLPGAGLLGAEASVWWVLVWWVLVDCLVGAG